MYFQWQYSIQYVLTGLNDSNGDGNGGGNGPDYFGTREEGEEKDCYDHVFGSCPEGFNAAPFLCFL